MAKLSSTTPAAASVWSGTGTASHFDEFAANRRTDQNLVSVMKNYLANKSFSRGTSIYGPRASMAFIGNTTHTVPVHAQNSDLFDELPRCLPR